MCYVVFGIHLPACDLGGQQCLKKRILRVRFEFSTRQQKKSKEKKGSTMPRTYRGLDPLKHIAVTDLSIFTSLSIMPILIISYRDRNTCCYWGLCICSSCICMWRNIYCCRSRLEIRRSRCSRCNRSGRWRGIWLRMWKRLSSSSPTTRERNKCSVDNRVNCCCELTGGI
jgi:hypothetical protein